MSGPRDDAAEPLFYIQDTRSFVGDSVLWWRPKGAGYTINLEEAGTYTAEQCRGKRETDRPIPVEVARKVATTHVIAGRLFEAIGPRTAPAREIDRNRLVRLARERLALARETEDDDAAEAACAVLASLGVDEAGDDLQPGDAS